MTAARTDSFLGRLIADATDKDVLPTFSVFLQDQIRMVGNLPHLHDESENICIIIQHYATAHVSIELSARIGHDTLREIAFNLPEEFIAQNNT